MESSDFEDIVAQGRHIGRLFATVYKDIVGEDLDLESALKHYPLLALGIAAGVGATAGWWVGRRNRQALPPPSQTQNVLPTERTGGKFGRIEDVLPDTVSKVRSVLPEVVVSNELRMLAKGWFDNYVEPKLQENIEQVVAGVDTKLGSLLTRFMQHAEPGGDVHLEDPENPK